MLLFLVLMYSSYSLAFPGEKMLHHNLLETRESTYSEFFETCQGKDGSCQCCCLGANPSNPFQYKDCHNASVWMIGGMCPPGLPLSIPSSSCSYSGHDQWPQATNPQCSLQVTVDDLQYLCDLSGCENGVAESCGCLDKYINSCFAVNNTFAVPEPCSFTRSQALKHFQEKSCQFFQGPCPKPIYHSQSPLKDNCKATAKIGETCQLSCADGFQPSNPEHKSAVLACSAAGYVVKEGFLECVEGAKCELISASLFPMGKNPSSGVVHDCQDQTPLGSYCVMSCAAGYRSSITEDHVQNWCTASEDGIATFNATITCESSLCTIEHLPAQVRHGCRDGMKIGETCPLVCEKGFVGQSVTATCTGHGGKDGFPAYARFQFPDIECLEDLEALPTEMSSLQITAFIDSDPIPLAYSPDFMPNVFLYSLKVPNRYSELRFAVKTNNSNPSSIVCENCTTSFQMVYLNVGTNFVKISVGGKKAITNYTIVIERENVTISEKNVNSQHEFTAIIKLDAEYSNIWDTTYRYSLEESLQHELMIDDNTDVSVKNVLPGVLVEFKVSQSGTQKTVSRLLEKFDAIMSGSFKNSTCSKFSLCVTQIYVVKSLYESSLATPIQNPKQAANVNCSDPEAIDCVSQFVDNRCSSYILTSTCEKWGICQAKEQSDPLSICNTLGCDSQIAKDCVDDFVKGDCNNYVLASGCEEYFGCQMRALAYDCKPVPWTAAQLVWIRTLSLYSSTPKFPFMNLAAKKL